MEVVPHPPGGLNEDARSRVELVDVSLNSRKLSQERLFIHHAHVRVDDRALWLSLSKRGQREDACKRHRAEHET